jgi:hypothetical protein
MSLQPMLLAPPTKKRQSYSHPERLLTADQKPTYRHSADFGTSQDRRNEAIFMPSSEQEGSTSKRSSGGSSRSSILLHLKSVLPWTDSGLWTPPESRRNSIFIPPQQHKAAYDGSEKFKPLPPLPIEDNLNKQDEASYPSSSKFRYVCGRQFLKNTGEECFKDLDLSIQLW